MCQTTLATNHGYNKRYVCKPSPWDMVLRSLGGNRYSLYRTDSDSNPGNPGFFEQTATLELTPSGELQGKGTHRGKAITHGFDVKGRRGSDDRCAIR